jgi:hypothetical protein
MPARYLAAGAVVIIAGRPEDVWAVVLGANDVRIRTSVTGWHTAGLDQLVPLA